MFQSKVGDVVLFRSTFVLEPAIYIYPNFSLSKEVYLRISGRIFVMKDNFENVVI